MKLNKLRKSKKIIALVAMLLCVNLVTPLGASAQDLDEKMKEGMNVNQLKVLEEKDTEDVYEDYVPNQPEIEKDYGMVEIHAKLGVGDFWNNIDGEEVSQYYINDDLSVSFKDNTKLSSKKEQQIKDSKRKNFEKQLKEYVSKIESYNNKESKVKKSSKNSKYTDGKGGLKIGSYPGDGTGSNSLTVSGLVKGDILLLEDDGQPQIQGAIMHAGIYDGSNMDMCIYSSTDGVGVRWECVSDWRKNDCAWTLCVKNTTTSQRTAAWDKMKSECQYREPYKWNSSKSNVDEWYCSKQPWYGYKNSSVNKDIDFDGGYWVLPIDIYNDSDVQLIATYK